MPEALYLFNPSHVVDALDEEASEIERFTSGRIACTKRDAGITRRS